MSRVQDDLLALIKNCLCSIPCEKRDDVVDYLEYANAIETVWQQLESVINRSRDPKFLALEALRIACEFYQGDWCGILDVDEELGVWTPFWWYDAETKGMTPTIYEKYEPTSPFPRWLDALHQIQPVVIDDVEAVKSECYEEYLQYQRQQVVTAIGAPYHKRTVGFLMVKNPKRYMHRLNLLQLMAYMAAVEVNEWKELDGSKFLLDPALRVHSEPDFTIQMFGGLTIRSKGGELTEQIIHSPTVCRVLVYLALNSQRGISSRELSTKIWPETGLEDKPGEKLRHNIHRFRQKFKEALGDNFLITVNEGYKLNPALDIVTDVQMFEQYWQSGDMLDDPIMKIRFYTQAFQTYRGDLMANFATEHWLAPDVSYYRGKYLLVAQKLFKLLDAEQQYEPIRKMALEGIRNSNGHADFYFWAIYALQKMGEFSRSEQGQNAAKQQLSTPDYERLLERLAKATGTTE